MVIWWGWVLLGTIHNRVRCPAGAGTLHYQRLVLTVFDGCSCVSRPFILGPSGLCLWLGGGIGPTPLPMVWVACTRLHAGCQWNLCLVPAYLAGNPAG